MNMSPTFWAGLHSLSLRVNSAKKHLYLEQTQKGVSIFLSGCRQVATAGGDNIMFLHLRIHLPPSLHEARLKAYL